LRHLEDARHARDAILDAIDLLATAARRDGATYAQIGRALGISRQAARQALVAVELDRSKRAEDHTWRMPPRQRDRRPRISEQAQHERPRVVSQ
jgi:hypothetical protein